MHSYYIAYIISILASTYELVHDVICILIKFLVFYELVSWIVHPRDTMHTTLVEYLLSYAYIIQDTPCIMH